jgi:hypothetical protein
MVNEEGDMTDSNGTVRYSEKIDGDQGNYDWQVRFDVTDNGYLGINQYEGKNLADRVLLSPAQVQELIDFVRKRRSRRAA